jgi:hypothetical protein
MWERFDKCEPVVTKLVKARDRGLADRTLSHAGPPFVDRRSIPAPVLHALAGSAVLEGWGKTSRTSGWPQVRCLHRQLLAMPS